MGTDPLVRGVGDRPDDPTGEAPTELLGAYLVGPDIDVVPPDPHALQGVTQAAGQGPGRLDDRQAPTVEARTTSRKTGAMGSRYRMSIGISTQTG